MPHAISQAENSFVEATTGFKTDLFVGVDLALKKVTQIIATINVTLTREEFKTKVAELVTPAEGHGSVAPIGPLFNREALEGIWDIRISRLKNANDTLERMWKLFSEQRKDFYTLLDVIFQDPSWKSDDTTRSD